MVSTRTRSAAAEARKKPALHDITNDGKGGAKRKSAGGQIAEAGPQTVAKEEVPVAARTRSTRKKDSAVAGRADIVAKFAAGQKGDVPAEALEAKFERAANGYATGKKRKPLEPIQHEAPKRKEKRLTRAASRKDAGTRLPGHPLRAFFQSRPLESFAAPRHARLPPLSDPATPPDATDGDQAIVDPEVIDLTCDERLISERGEYSTRQPLPRSSFKKPLPAHSPARFLTFSQPWPPPRDLAPLPHPRASGLILATGGDVGAAEDVYPFSVDGGRRLNEKRIELQPYVTNGHLFR